MIKQPPAGPLLVVAFTSFFFPFLFDKGIELMLPAASTIVNDDFSKSSLTNCTVTSSFY